MPNAAFNSTAPAVARLADWLASGLTAFLLHSIIAAHASDLKVGLFTDNVKDFEKISNLKIVHLRV